MLNLFDFIISSVIITFFLSGLFTGAVRLMLNNISFIASILLSSILFAPAQSMVGEYIDSGVISNVISLCISYIISLIVCSMLFRKIKLLIKPICGGLIDKTGGAMLGLLNGCLVCAMLFIAAVGISSGQDIAEYKNLYSLVQSLDKKSYPKWLKNSNSFDIIDKGLKVVLQIPYVDKLLMQINFDDVFSKLQDVQHSKASDHKVVDDKLFDQKINTLFE